MPWKSARPQNNWGDDEKTRWDQESYDRGKFGVFTWTPPACGAGVTQFVLSATGPDIVSNVALGLRIGNPVSLTPPSAFPTNVNVYCLVAAVDSLTIVVDNTTGGASTPPAGTWSYNGMVA